MYGEIFIVYTNDFANEETIIIIDDDDSVEDRPTDNLENE